MWARQDGDGLEEKSLRHTCEQGDRMDGYGWTAYDPRHGGSQVIHDMDNGLDMTTEFLRSSETGHDGYWAARIKGSPSAGSNKAHKSMAIFNIGLERVQTDPSPSLDCKAEQDAVRCNGSTPELGEFHFSVQRPRSTKSDIAVRSVSVPDDELWQAKCEYADV